VICLAREVGAGFQHEQSEPDFQRPALFLLALGTGPRRNERGERSSGSRRGSGSLGTAELKAAADPTSVSNPNSHPNLPFEAVPQNARAALRCDREAAPEDGMDRTLLEALPDRLIRARRASVFPALYGQTCGFVRKPARIVSPIAFLSQGLWPAK
jgi:hypothetical protein